MKSFIDKITLALLPWLGAQIARLLFSTIRVKQVGRQWVEPFFNEGRHVIFAFWHGRLLMLPFAYAGKEVYVLISRSKDGELIARFGAHLNMHAVRGSSSRGGLSAIRDILRLHKKGVDFGFTPDGPRGPRHVVQQGVIEIARITGLPIIPLTFSASKKKLCVPGMAF